MQSIRTPDQLFQELFEAVQSGQLLEDSKTFVDAAPRGEPADILAAYRSESRAGDFDLLAFVRSYFDLPETGDAHLHGDKQRPVREHIESMWDVLTRARDEAHPHDSLLALPRPYIVPGDRFREVYYWDSYFTMLGLAAAGRVEMIDNMVANFGFLIDRIGFIPNGNRSYYCTRSQPPFFALMVALLAEVKGDPGILHFYLPQLEREYEFWMADADELNDDNPASRRVVLAGDALLNRYWDDASTPRQESHVEDVELAEHSDREPGEIYRDIRAGAESGWDYTSRWFADARQMTSIRTTHVVPVDLNALMCKLESVLARSCDLAGDPDKSRDYGRRAAVRREALQTRFFDDEAGFFTDLLLPDLGASPTLSLAAAYPLFFELATDEQARQVAKRLRERFLKPGGWVTTNEPTGQQWDSPNGWAPLQWIVYRGLLNYGYREDAEEGARRWIENNLGVYRQTGALVEKYDVEQPGVVAGGGEYAVQDGFGWTNGVLLRLMDDLGL